MKANDVKAGRLVKHKTSRKVGMITNVVRNGGGICYIFVCWPNTGRTQAESIHSLEKCNEDR